MNFVDIQLTTGFMRPLISTSSPQVCCLWTPGRPCCACADVASVSGLSQSNTKADPAPYLRHFLKARIESLRQQRGSPRRLFSRLWDRGLVLVATSNRAPDALYEGGLQRNLFLPFIERLKSACVVHDMASTTDYRRMARHRHGLYFTTPSREKELHEAFLDLGHGRTPEPQQIGVMMGRHLDVPQALDGGCGSACKYEPWMALLWLVAYLWSRQCNCVISRLHLQVRALDGAAVACCWSRPCNCVLSRAAHIGVGFNEHVSACLPVVCTFWHTSKNEEEASQPPGFFMV